MRAHPCSSLASRLGAQAKKTILARTIPLAASGCASVRTVQLLALVAGRLLYVKSLIGELPGV